MEEHGTELPGTSVAGGLGQWQVVHRVPSSCLKVQRENEHLMVNLQETRC